MQSKGYCIATTALLYQKFFYALRWNALETIIYQAIFLAHNLVLFHAVSSSTWGLIGTLFSLIYLTITVSNAGFDSSLAPFFKHYTASKQTFKKFLIPQIILGIALLIFAALGLVIAITQWNFLGTVPPSLLPIVGLLVISEGTKKSLRSFLHLGFNNPVTTSVELASIVGYTGCVWGWHLLGNPITIQVIFLPLLAVSLISTAVLTYYSYRLYSQLPDVASIHELTVGRIIYNRGFTSITQLSHQLVSSNFLVPFFAMSSGLNEAGLFKFISTMYHSLSTVLYKIFGSSAEAVWSHATTLSMHERRTLFATMSNQLQQLLFVCALFCIMNTKTILMSYGTHQDTVVWLIAVLYGLLQLSEHLFIVHEKFLIAHEKALYLCIGTLIMLLTSACIIRYSSPITMLIALLSVRLVSFILISAVTFYTWRIKPSWSFHPASFAYALIASLALFLIVR